MPEGPFGNIEINGPFTINEILLSAMKDELSYGINEKQLLIEEINNESSVIKLGFETTKLFKTPESNFYEPKIIFITRVGDEPTLEEVNEIVELLEDNGFEDFTFHMGDPGELAESILDKLNTE